MLRDSFLDPICASVCYILSDGSTVEHANDTALRFIRSTAYKKTKALLLQVESTSQLRACGWIGSKGWWWSYEYMKIIYISYIWTTGWRIIWKMIIAVIDATFAVAKRNVFINLKKASTLYWSCRISIETVVKLMWQIQIYAVTPCIKKKNGSVCFKRYWHPIFSLKQSSRYLADTMVGPVDVQVPNTVFCRRKFSYSETCMKRCPKKNSWYEGSLTYGTTFFSHFNQVPVQMSYLHVVSTHLKNNNPVSTETADVVQWFAYY